MSKFIVNSFQVPNELVDELMSTMSANALRCYLLITRKTTGWGKSSDKISTTQFMSHLGIKDKRTIYVALSELTKLKLINAIKNNGEITEYSLITEPQEPVIKNVGTKNATGSKECTEPVAKNDTTTSSKKCTSTKDNIKNNITKEKIYKKDSFDPVSVKPKNLSLETWINWIEYKKAKKQSLIPSTWKAQSEMLEQHINPEAVINLSIMNGWQGLFPERVNGKSPGKKPNQPFASQNYGETKQPDWAGV